MTDRFRSMCRGALIALLVVGAAPSAARAQGAPQCAQIITCVAGNVFTTPGDSDCNRSIELSDLRLLVQAQFCDPCRACLTKDVNGDGRVSIADVTAFLRGVPQILSTVTPTRTATGTPTATDLPGSDTRTPTASATRTPIDTVTPTITRTPTAAPATDYSFAFAFGESGFAIPALSKPSGVAIGADGHILIADARDRVLELDATGKYLRTIGLTGSEAGQFNDPRGLGFDPSGNLYVADAGNNRIQKFAPSGQFLLQFGAARAASEDLGAPACVTVRTGVVFVCDTVHNNIKRFSTSGVFQGQWGSEGFGPGEFALPVDIAFDADGYAYVVDLGNNRVQKFDASFAHVLDIGTSGPDAERLDAPTAIAIGADQRLYVSDLGNTIKVYATDGGFVGAAGETGSGPGQFNFPRDVAFDAGGNLYVADTDNDRLQKLDADLQPLWTLVDGLLGRFVAPVAIATSALQGIVVSDTVGDQARIAFFRPNGEPDGDLRIASGGNPGPHAGSGLAIAPNGGFYLADSTNQSIAKFSADRRLIRFFGTPGSGPGQFTDPRGIAVDAIGNLFVVDAGNHRVQKLDSDGVPLDLWGGFGSGAGQFDAPQGIAVFGDRVYVADSGNDRIQVFNRSGTFLTQWGASGEAPPQFMTPRGVAVDRDGYVYVVDAGNDRVQKFSPDGAFLVSFGHTSPGRFIDSIGVAVADNGDVLVVNAGEKRVVVWQTPQ
ncbi:MAG: 6-bladed beta-propeller [Deltaproteobacteria bacterium]|nr:6-bladed beta-propeller [Deltaproteobacteria bacterium]